MTRTYPERWIEVAEARDVRARAMLDQAAVAPRRGCRPGGAAMARMPLWLAGLLRRRRHVGGAVNAID